jgi:hypothetical protein
MEQSIASYHRLRNRTFAGVMALGGLLMAWAAFGSANREFFKVPPQEAVAILIVAFAWLGRNWAWRKAISNFAHRVPVGPAQSWLDDRQEVATASNWGTLLWSGTAFFIFSAMLWLQGDPKHWLPYASVAVVGLAACFDIFLKWRASRS